VDREDTQGALQALSPFERMDRYRQYAATALDRAEHSDCDAAKATLLDIAARWDGLAQDIERRLDLLD
jgi:hypothetical protein